VHLSYQLLKLWAFLELSCIQLVKKGYKCSPVIKTTHSKGVSVLYMMNSLLSESITGKLTSQVGHSCQVLDNSTTWHNIPEANAMLVAVAVFYRFYRCHDPSFLSLANITICSCSPAATSSEPNPAILICKQNTFCWFKQALGYAYNQNFFVYKRG
jgi:hypothetical protein